MENIRVALPRSLIFVLASPRLTEVKVRIAGVKTPRLESGTDNARRY
jgi:hypothetical protein